MAQLIIVGMFLVGLCAFVWTLIAQEAPSAAGFGPPLTRRLHGLHPWHRLRGIDLPRRTADTAERLRATARTLALRVRAALSRPRVRFAQALATTAPVDAAPAAGHAGVHNRGGRVLAALELVVLIAVVGGIVAAVVLGAGHIVLKSLGGHFHSS